MQVNTIKVQFKWNQQEFNVPSSDFDVLMNAIKDKISLDEDTSIHNAEFKVFKHTKSDNSLIFIKNSVKYNANVRMNWD
jgi:hypothetical protein